MYQNTTRESDERRRAMRPSSAPRGRGSTGDAEGLRQALRLSQARVARLASAVEAEEGALVQAALAEAEAATAARVASARAAREAEHKLQMRVGQARQLLKQEQGKLHEVVQGDRARLALAVDQGVTDYFTGARSLRMERRAVQGVAAGAAQPGSTLYRLRDEERRLDEACRTLRAEMDAMAIDEVCAACARTMASPWPRRAGLLTPLATLLARRRWRRSRIRSLPKPCGDTMSDRRRACSDPQLAQ